MIGRGEFGEIFLAKLSKSAVTNTEKRNSRAISPSDSAEDKDLIVMVKSLAQTKDENCLLEFKREIDVFCKLDHENIVKLWGLCREIEPHFMILEYADWVSIA